MNAWSLWNASSRSPCSASSADLPGRRRIDEQQRAVFAAELRRDQQHARTDVAVARRRRDADEVQVLDVAQREQAGARARRSR